MREKLIELLQCSPTDIMGNHGIGALADHLIANDVAPVVRCKDCKHFDYCFKPQEQPMYIYCFCSLGERKDK